jgi:hypothetical protein
MRVSCDDLVRVKRKGPTQRLRFTPTVVIMLRPKTCPLYPDPDGGEVSPLTPRVRVLVYSNSIYTETYPLLLTCYPD